MKPFLLFVFIVMLSFNTKANDSYELTVSVVEGEVVNTFAPVDINALNEVTSTTNRDCTLKAKLAASGESHLLLSAELKCGPVDAPSILQLPEIVVNREGGTALIELGEQNYQWRYSVTLKPKL